MAVRIWNFECSCLQWNAGVNRWIKMSSQQHKSYFANLLMMQLKVLVSIIKRGELYYYSHDVSFSIILFDRLAQYKEYHQLFSFTILLVEHLLLYFFLFASPWLKNSNTYPNYVALFNVNKCVFCICFLSLQLI